MTQLPTHDVFNQVPVYDGYNLFETDKALLSAVNAEDAGWAAKGLTEFGGRIGTAEWFDKGDKANRHLPELHRFDARGFPLNTVEFHPAYHDFMALSKGARIHCGAFDHLAEDDRPKDMGVGVARAAKHYMVGQVEAGHVCPITMTHAAIPALMVQPDIAKAWLPKILSPEYDPEFKPWFDKSGVTLGMGMTEKQGGTDVRANTTTATPLGKGGGGQVYAITGHKWFMSAPMCDAFLVLAQAEGGLSVFLVPRFKENGAVNGIYFQRLKNKLGNKSNASSEVEFIEAHGYLLGEEGRGVPNIMTMANYTRLDCALGSAGQARQAVHRAWHHVTHRTVFQKKLINQPMMSALIADLAIETESLTHMALALAGAYERAARGDETAQALSRVMTPVVKYWVTKRAPEICYEAMECHGGNGYVEDGIMARLYRDVPVNSIWEGTGNVMALDLMRVMGRDRDAIETVISFFDKSRGHYSAYDAALDDLKRALSEPLNPVQGRWLMEKFAGLYAAGLMMSWSAERLTAAYIDTRLAPTGKAACLGTLPAALRPESIIADWLDR